MTIHAVIPFALFILLYKVIQAMESAGKILRCDFSNEFFLDVLFIVLKKLVTTF